MKLPPLFNPSNDMALATNLRQYFPPRRIQQMEADLADLARLWDEGPWGWSLATKQRYLRMGIPEDELPSDQWLAEVRSLSSREFAAGYYSLLTDTLQAKQECDCLLPCRARFCTTLDDVLSSISSSQYLMIKSPWSSSGRGNIVVDGHLSPPFGGVRGGRIERILREQGGVVVEPFYADKVLDFALEFQIGDNGARFLGYSVFDADETGHYCGNYVESQEQLLKRIGLPDELLQDLVKYHEQALAGLPYRGPVGIDMMRLQDGRVHPCVEINFRRTMGWLALLLYNRGIRDDQLLTPNRTHGFVSSIHQGRLVIVARE